MTRSAPYISSKEGTAVTHSPAALRNAANYHVTFDLPVFRV